MLFRATTRKIPPFPRAAVGIEPGSARRGWHDSVAIAGNVALLETLGDPSEPQLEAHPRTRVPSTDSLYNYEWVRSIWGALRVV